MEPWELLLLFDWLRGLSARAEAPPLFPTPPSPRGALNEGNAVNGGGGGGAEVAAVLRGRRNLKGGSGGSLMYRLPLLPSPLLWSPVLQIGAAPNPTSNPPPILSGEGGGGAEPQIWGGNQTWGDLRGRERGGHEAKEGLLLGGGGTL